MAFATFMAGPIGRMARIVLGVVLVLLGLFAMSGAAGWIVALIGVVAVLAGALNFCLIGPLIKAPFSGKDLAR